MYSFCLCPSNLGADHLTLEGGGGGVISGQQVFFFSSNLGGQDIFPSQMLCRIFFFCPHFSAGFFFLKKVSCLHLQNVFKFTLWLLQ